MRNALLVVAVAGCAGNLPLPLTAGQLVTNYDTPGALVAYLGQPDASAAVCDPLANGPHVAQLGADMRLALVKGVEHGKIDPALWQKCVNLALANLPADQASSLLDDVVQAYRRMLDDEDLATSPRLAASLEAAQRVYLDRAPGLAAHAKVVAPMLAELRGKLAKHELAPIAASYANELVENDDVEHGTWHGKPVDVAMLDELAAAGNELTLARFADRLPYAQLRDEAKRRIVRVHVVLSPFDEVRADAARVEDAVVKTGENRVSLAEHALQRAWLDPRSAPQRDVLVRQHVWQQEATLLGFAPNRPKLSVLPDLALRGSLFAELDGVSKRVTLCQPARELDPSPCIDVADVSIASPLAYLDRDGAFHLRDNLSEAEIERWSSDTALDLPIRLAGAPAVALHWGLYFERPDNLVFDSGGRGPDLAVHVAQRPTGRYVFAIGAYTAVVESDDLASYRVVSRGADGSSGSDGSPGMDGSSGGECQNGGDGSSGGNGGDGGDGSDGGDVAVTIVCATGDCAIGTLERIVRSEGGAGGAGGSGGRGGAGGSGGPSRSPTTHTDSDGNTVTDDPGCSAGSSGSSGSDGSPGSSGRSGNPGQVTFQVVH